jgi:hypothetical protein
VCAKYAAHPIEVAGRSSIARTVRPAASIGCAAASSRTRFRSARGANALQLDDHFLAKLAAAEKHDAERGGRKRRADAVMV